MAHIITFDGNTPRIHPSAFIAPGAVLIGDVEIGEGSSVWFGAVLRADHPRHGIRVGRRTSVQDNVVVHVSDEGPTLIGDDATIGHGSVFESCHIRQGALIGMNAVLLHRSIIGEESLVAALSVVPAGMEVPPRTLVAGAPARVRKELDGAAADWIRAGGGHYVELSRGYLAQGIGRPTG